MGGVDTLFKESSQKVQQYADNAYKTAGLSANAYMETVTSFSASLLQSLDGDTAKAADAADQAIIDMADNANKMGTSMESIQNAYQGFAKQNYTMLDNLKLGYGGTKEEMARLLADASAISGIEYDISSFADVTQAIHVMQEEMGIAGATAKEANTTISGSAGAMKASWENLVTGIANGDADMDSLINNFVETVKTTAENIVPAVEDALTNIGDLVNTLLPVVLEEVPNIINNLLPELLSCGTGMINSILTGFQENLPTIIDCVITLVTQLSTSLLGMLPTIIELGMQLIINLALGIAEALPELIPTIIETVLAIVQVFVDNLPLLIDAGMQLLMGLITGIIDSMPILLEQLPVLIDGIITALLEALPMLIECGVQLLTALVEALPEIISGIVAVLPQIIDGITTALLEALPLLVECGIQLLTSLVEALPEIISAIVEVLPTIIDSVINALLQALPLLIQCAIQLVLALVEALPTIIIELVNALPNVITSIVNALIDNLPLIIACGIQLFMALIKALPTIIVEIVKAIPQIILAIVRAFGELKGSMTDVFSNAWDAVVNFCTQTIPDLISNIGVWFSELPGKIAYWLGHVITKAVLWAAEMKAKAQDAAKNFVDSAIKFIKELPQKIWTWFLNVIKKVIQFRKDLIDKAKEIGKKFVDELIDFVKDLPENFKEIGSDIISGIWDGISAGWNWLKDKVSNLVSNLFQGAKDALEDEESDTKPKGTSGSGSTTKKGAAGIVKGTAYAIIENDSNTALQKAIQANIGAVKTTFAGAYAAGNYGSAGINYKKLGNEVAGAFEKSGFKVVIEKREFGRIVREVTV